MRRHRFLHDPALTCSPQAELRKEFDAFKARRLGLDVTRGKPAPERLDLSNELLRLPDNADWHADGSDTRNYAVH